MSIDVLGCPTKRVHARRPTNRVSPKAIVHSARMEAINLKKRYRVNFLRRNLTKNWGHTGFVKKKVSPNVPRGVVQVVNFFFLG